MHKYENTFRVGVDENGIMPASMLSYTYHERVSVSMDAPEWLPSGSVVDWSENDESAPMIGYVMRAWLDDD